MHCCCCCLKPHVCRARERPHNWALVHLPRGPVWHEQQHGNSVWCLRALCRLDGVTICHVLQSTDNIAVRPLSCTPRRSSLSLPPYFFSLSHSLSHSLSLSLTFFLPFVCLLLCSFRHGFHTKYCELVRLDIRHNHWQGESVEPATAVTRALLD